VAGTNLWVIPKEVPDTTQEEEQRLWANNYARVDFVTAYFSIDAYKKLFSDDGNWKIRVNSGYYFFTGHVFEWTAYKESI
jgi:hypothetical protein